VSSAAKTTSKAAAEPVFEDLVPESEPVKKTVSGTRIQTSLEPVFEDLVPESEPVKTSVSVVEPEPMSKESVIHDVMSTNPSVNELVSKKEELLKSNEDQLEKVHQEVDFDQHDFTRNTEISPSNADSSSLSVHFTTILLVCVIIASIIAISYLCRRSPAFSSDSSDIAATTVYSAVQTVDDDIENQMSSVQLTSIGSTKSAIVHSAKDEDSWDDEDITIQPNKYEVDEIDDAKIVNTSLDAPKSPIVDTLASGTTTLRSPIFALSPPPQTSFSNLSASSTKYKPPSSVPIDDDIFAVIFLIIFYILYDF
jgi:hypothetical protein